MSKIYQITADFNSTMMLAIDDMDVYEQMGDFSIDAIGAGKLPFTWKAPKGEFLPSDTGSLVKPDITKWSTNDLVVARRVVDSLSSHLNTEVAELLPLEGGVNDYLFINPIRRLPNDVVDLDNTQSIYFDDGAWDKLKRLVLKKSAIGMFPAIFTLDINNGVELYGTESFKEVIERNQLNGLVFQEVQTN